ncbi:TonB-dependent siderophore receptor [Neorhizobium petrolearium]|uniref:TonB-dependent siderophore receptor n=1 Tax=Neorhizobium petrolearium TaxID=515361 RepID=A0ABY8MB90_9HYPH|nr:TonB-dependent siderophore receptor [Neorhizobium petrolearium]MCC2610577.1 TonB-dependent siderophore receptor [Neorhizobium petrolearium]WGI70715.1 TonB-dependent siderophore receptor [Neorhizobium petrolearium]
MGKRKGFFRIRLGLGASVALIGICAGWAAEAQNADTTLAPIVLQGEGEGESATGPVKGYVAKKSATGSKTDTPLNEIPQSVSVVGKQEMNDRGVVNKIDEALRYTPGVTAEPFGTDPDTDWVYIRGFDATQTGVFYDGLNLFSYGFGGFQVDPFMLERVDVLKGPASVLYGGGNAGGILNYIRKRPTDEPYYYTEIGINSNGNAFGGFDISDKVGDSDTMTYRLTGKVAGGDNYSDYSEDLRGFIMPQLTISPDEATKLTVWGSVSGLDQVHTGNGFFPYVGTVVDAPFGKIDRDAFYGEPDIDEGKYTQQMVGYEFEHEFDSGWKFSSNFRYGHLWKHEEGPYLYGYVGGTPTAPDYELYRIGFEATSKVDTVAIDNRAETEFDLGATRHDLMVGIDYKYYRLDHIQACCGATPISTTDPVYGVPQGANFVYIDQVVTQQQIGGYVQDQIRFGDGWLVTLNGRYDFVHTDTDDRLTSSSYSYDKSAASGRAGLAYQFDNGLTPYASVGTFFNPTVAVSTTPNNKPEEGEQYEVGLKYDPTFIDGTFTASLFHLTKRNVAVTDPATSLSEQIGEVESRGIELEGKVNLNENWKLLGSFSYTDLEVTEDLNPAYIGKKPYLVPDMTASLWLDYTVTQGALEGLSLGGGVRYQGESWADRENTLKVPDAAVFDAAIRYRKDGWEGSINVTNVFDKEYVRGCGGAYTCGYGDARTVTFKLSKVW